MLGRPLRDRVAMRATMLRRRMSSTAGSSLFIFHLPQRSIIPGDGLERDHLHPGVTAGHPRRSPSLPKPPTDVEGTQVEEVDPFVNEENDLLARFWLTISMKRKTGQVTTVLPDQRDWLSLWALVVCKTETCARNPLEQVPCAVRIDVPADRL